MFVRTWILSALLIACGGNTGGGNTGGGNTGGGNTGGGNAGGGTVGGGNAGGGNAGGGNTGGGNTGGGSAGGGGAGLPFTRQPVNAAMAPLCNIPPGWVPDSGVAATFISCEVAADRFSTQDPNVAPAQLRVVAWNIEFNKNHATVLNELKTRVELKDADVLLLSEVSRNSLTSSPQNIDGARALAQQLGLDYVFAVEWDRRAKPSELGEHGVAVLSRYPIGNVTQIRHVPLNDWWSGDRLYGGRISLGADLWVAGRLLRVYATHLCTRGIGDSGRARQAAELRADADLSTRPSWQVVGGDFNTFTCNPALANCTVPPSAEAAVKDFLQAGWTDGTAGWNGVTQLGAGVFPQRLDWLFYRGGLGAPGQGVTTQGSDHRAVFTTLAW